jgi:hypothetical protein
MAMKTFFPWVVIAILGVICALIAARPPKEIIHNIPIEVIKEIPKDVIREVIKEVPKEVIKEITKEVIKEVPASLTPAEIDALDIGKKVLSGKNGNEAEALYGIRSVDLVIEISTSLKNAVNEGTIRTAAELELRRSGIQIDAKATTVVRISLEATGTPESRYGYVVNVALYDSVALFRNEKVIFVRGKLWEAGSYGTIGPTALANLEDNYSKHLKKLLNDYLAVNPIKRN